MVKLTPQLIDDAVERTNPCRERELILRGLKFSVIENLGIGLDMYDSYDLCDNDIQKFGNFPNLVRCRQVYACNNRISYVAGDVHVKLPNLSEINLTNNDIRSLTNIKRLEKCMCLKFLTFARNPISLEQNYRKFAIYTIKSLKFLDFQRITDKERAEAKKLFEELPEGKLLLAKITAKAKEEAEDIMFGEDDVDDDMVPGDSDDESNNNKKRKKRKKGEKDGFEKGNAVEMVVSNVESDVDKQMKEIDNEQRAKIKKAILRFYFFFGERRNEKKNRLNRIYQ